MAQAVAPPAESRAPRPKIQGVRLRRGDVAARQKRPQMVEDPPPAFGQG